MKKLTFLIGAIMLASFSLTSCGGNSMESDAKKMAEIQCEAMGLMEKAMAGDETAMAEGEALGKKAETLAKELEEKYSTDELKAEFKAAMEKEFENNCK